MDAKRAARIVALAAAALAAPPPGLAAAPASPKEIPIFPGATRDTASEREQGSERGQEGSRWLRSYASGAAAEDVFRFYERSFGAKRNDGWYDGRPPPPGGATVVRYGLTLRQPDELEPKIRSALTKDRKPLEEGAYLSEAIFEWERLSSKGESTGCLVRVLDVGSEGDVYRRATRIDHDCASSENPEVSREREVEKDRAERSVELQARARSLAAKPPTEKELGVAIYPGAKFEPATTAGLVSPGFAMWVFTTGDSPARVRSFYEKKLGKKAEEPSGGVFVIPIRGTYPTGEHVMVSDNPGTGRGTAIWVQRQGS